MEIPPESRPMGERQPCRARAAPAAAAEASMGLRRKLPRGGRALENLRAMATSMAVSYTHLDVYKRQGIPGDLQGQPGRSGGTAGSPHFADIDIEEGQPKKGNKKGAAHQTAPRSYHAKRRKVHRVFLAENDLVPIEAIDDGQGFHPDAHIADELAALLKALFNGNATARNGGAGLVDNVD